MTKGIDEHQAKHQLGHGRDQTDAFGRRAQRLEVKRAESFPAGTVEPRKAGAGSRKWAQYWPGRLAISAAAILATALMNGCAENHASPAPAFSRHAASVKPAALLPLEVRRAVNGTRVFSFRGDLYFAFDSAALRPSARRQLQDELVPHVMGHLETPGAFVAIRGHADSVGAADYNLQLSRRRADAVKHVLVKGGVPADLVIAEGRGEPRNASGPSSALRRVDIVLGGRR